MIVYKIRNKKSGLYSTGGYYPRFEKTGKTWRSKAALNLHISQMSEYHRNTLYDNTRNNYIDVEVVPIQVTETELEGIPFEVHNAERLAAKQKRDTQEQAKAEKRAKDARLKQFQELQKEFGQ